MPRKGIINGNGYECDICGQLLKSHDVFRVGCVKTVGHTGELRMLDSIGVCEECYRKNSLICVGKVY